MLDPLHQFAVRPLVPLHLGEWDISITNVTVFMVSSAVAVVLFFYLTTNQKSVIPSRFQAIGELLYQFVMTIVKENLGIHGRPYFPFVFSIFMFVLFGNLIGLIPYAYTITSQVIVTFTLAMFVFMAVILSGLWHHGFGFLRMFLPSGSPLVLAPLLVPIEIISFLARPLSLSLRLFVNMVAGHCILKILSFFGQELGAFGIIPLAFNILFISFEVLVAFIQAYIFATLSCIYLKDALDLH
jgi:F-type H+-transporting ATPase subunit a